jgi:hypothetical protein
MLKDIWLVQPLAFARGGSSPTPLQAFDWGPPDLSPSGSGRTRVVPADTLALDPVTGEVSLTPAAAFTEVRFKDGDRLRPVCPFFELHGSWETPAGLVEGPVTPEVLASSGKRAADLVWQVRFVNGKAMHWTKQPSDRVVAEVTIPGDHVAPVVLQGRSAATAQFPALVPEGKSVPLGRVQLSAPTADFPEFRLRFHPGEGKAYGPANINERVKALWWPGPNDQQPPDMIDFVWQMLQANRAWEGFSLPPEQCILDPAAAWPNYHLFTEEDVGPALIGAMDQLVTVAALSGDPSQLLRFLLGGASDKADVRNLPPGLYARATEPRPRPTTRPPAGTPPEPLDLFASMGMVDDFGDGIISCSIPGIGTATARIVSGPPDFAPDRRPPVSLADGLADRMLRAEVRQPGWASGDHAEVTELEVQELLARAFETMGLANLDVTNAYFQEENKNRALREKGVAAAYGDVAEMLWTADTPLSDEARAQLFLTQDPRFAEPLPLTALGRDAHRRNTVSLLFRALVLKDPGFMERWIRVPAGPDRYYDRKMPGLMRGGDRMPLTLTRRQYDLLAAWVAAQERNG